MEIGDMREIRLHSAITAKQKGIVDGEEGPAQLAAVLPM